MSITFSFETDLNVKDLHTALGKLAARLLGRKQKLVCKLIKWTMPFVKLRFPAVFSQQKRRSCDMSIVMSLDKLHKCGTT